MAAAAAIRVRSRRAGLPLTAAGPSTSIMRGFGHKVSPAPEKSPGQTFSPLPGRIAQVANPDPRLTETVRGGGPAASQTGWRGWTASSDHSVRFDTRKTSSSVVIPLQALAIPSSNMIRIPWLIAARRIS